MVFRVVEQGNSADRRLFSQKVVPASPHRILAHMHWNHRLHLQFYGRVFFVFVGLDQVQLLQEECDRFHLFDSQVWLYFLYKMTKDNSAHV